MNEIPGASLCDDCAGPECQVCNAQILVDFHAFYDVLHFNLKYSSICKEKFSTAVALPGRAEPRQTLERGMTIRPACDLKIKSIGL